MTVWTTQESFLIPTHSLAYLSVIYLSWSSKNPTDRGGWQATVHGVTESDSTEQLSMHGLLDLPWILLLFFSTCFDCMYGLEQALALSVLWHSHYSLTAFLSLFHTLLLTVPDAFSLLLAVKLPLTQPRHLFSLYDLKCLSLVPDAFPAGLSEKQCQGMERGKAAWCSERQCWDIQKGKASGNSERQCQGIERGKSLGLVRSSVKA